MIIGNVMFDFFCIFNSGKPTAAGRYDLTNMIFNFERTSYEPQFEPKEAIQIKQKQ